MLMIYIVQLSGLAKKIRYNSKIAQHFQQALVTTLGAKEAGKNTGLPRPVATRWNSTGATIMKAIQLEEAVNYLVVIPTLALSKFQLTPDQWKMAVDLAPILAVSYLRFNRQCSN